MIEETLAIIKPDGVKRGLTLNIINMLRDHGFEVTYFMPHIADSREVLTHYAENLSGQSISIINRVLTYWLSGPIIVLVLKKDNAIVDLRKLIGPSDPSLANKNTIRGKWGNDSYENAIIDCRSAHNIIHASDSLEAAEREKDIWVKKFKDFE